MHQCPPHRPLVGRRDETTGASAHDRDQAPRLDVDERDHRLLARQLLSLVRRVLQRDAAGVDLPRQLFSGDAAEITDSVVTTLDESVGSLTERDGAGCALGLRGALGLGRCGLCGLVLVFDEVGIGV